MPAARWSQAPASMHRTRQRKAGGLGESKLLLRENMTIYGFSWRKMLREEFFDAFSVLGPVEPRAAVPVAFHHHEFDLHAGLLQGIGQDLALISTAPGCPRRRAG